MAISPSEISELKAVIHQRLEFLLVLIDSNACGAAHPVVDDAVPENMFDTRMRGPKSTAVEQSEIELTQLTRTLTWLDSSRAGLCERCQNPLQIEKLKINPVSRECDACSQPNGEPNA